MGNEARETERQLVQRAQAGDSQAFGELVTQHMQRLYFAALGLVGSHDDALDMSQEAFVRAFRAVRSVDSNRPFYPWLYQIVRRLCFNFLRDRQTRRHKLAAASDWLAVENPNPAEHTERAELRAELERAIDQLATHEREVLVLREFEELTYREIADLLGIPTGTVMSRLYNARRSLAAMVEGKLS